MNNLPLQIRQSTPTYRKDIDGLRAIAVLSVVLFHIKPGLLPGGFIGVDIFFVVSGFLITSLLHGEMQGGRFAFRNFYSRRMRRLLPALYTVIAVTSLIGAFFLAPADLLLYAKSVLAAVTGMSNVYFWREYGGYFSHNSGEAPLIHTWSLAVEEQFYVIWPAAMIFLTRLRHAALYLVLSLLFLLSVAVSQVGVNNFAASSYYLVPTRFFELLIGGILAVWARNHPEAFSPRVSSVLAVAGAALILVPLFLFEEATKFPGVNALYPCLGAAALIAAGAVPNAVSRLLSHPVMVLVGLISYSLYLWHWPIIVAFKYSHTEITAAWAVAIFLGSVGISWLTWRFVELPFRYYKGNFARVFFFYYALPVLALLVASAAVIQHGGYPQRFGTAVAHAEAAVSTQPNKLRPLCHVASLYSNTPLNPACRLGDTSKAAVDGLLIGDSYANHFTGMLDVLAQSAGLSFADYTLDACLPLKNIAWGASSSYAGRCKARNDVGYALIAANKYHYVILAADWPRAPTSYLLIDGRPTESSRFAREMTAALNGSLDLIVAAGSVPVLIKSNETIDGADSCFIHASIFHKVLDCTAPLASLQEGRRFLDAMLADAVRRHPSTLVLDPSWVLCDSNRCFTMLEGTPVYRDNGHLNDVGSRLVGREILLKFGDVFSVKFRKAQSLMFQELWNDGSARRSALTETTNSTLE
jgi:peptidoglycan/LPS O-acetylase OafA/YrhL